MSAGYTDVRCAARGLRVEVRFRMENRGSEVWSGRDLCLGWQIYDPDTAIFISEGDWIPARRALAPGESDEYSLDVELPAESGRYHVYVSPRTERDGWFYRRQWPFVLVESAVEGGTARVDRAGPTTLARVHRRGLGARFRHGVAGPFLSIWRNRRLVASMVRREVAGRYRGSLGDASWALLHPLLLMATYYFVFGVVMNARFGADPTREGFVLYFLAGMLVWLPFSEAVGRSAGVLVENRNFVKKLVFPVEVLPLNPVAAGVVTEAFAFVILLGLLLAVRGWPAATVAWLPLLVLPRLLLTAGLCWFLSALGVFFRDLGQIIGFGLTLVFFLTPICYPESQLPEWAVGVLGRSPLFVLVKAYRAVILEARAPDWPGVAWAWAAGLLTFWAGHAFFWKRRKAFPDIL